LLEVITRVETAKRGLTDEYDAAQVMATTDFGGNWLTNSHEVHTRAPWFAAA
jgi:hypothetical protein